MRYIYYLIIIVVGILLVFASIAIAGFQGGTDLATTMLYVFALFVLIYILANYLLHTYFNVEYYNVMVKIYPKSAPLFYNRAVGYLRRADFEFALQNLQTAIQLKPKFTIAYLNRGLAYMGTRQYEQALQDFNYAQSLIPNNAIIYLHRGTIYSIKKRYQEALQDFDRVLKSKQRSLFSYAHIGKAEVYAHLKDYPQALQEYQYAITAAPRKADIYASRGLMYEFFDHFQEALQDSKHLVNSSSPSANMLVQYNIITATKCRVVGYIGCATAYIALKDYTAALEHIEQAIALDPQYAHSYYVRGLTYLWLNDMEQAHINIERSWQMNPLGSTYGLVLAWLDLCQHKPDQKIRERLEAIGKLDEMDYFAWVSRGIAQWIHGDYEEALTTLQQHIETELDTAFAYFWSGVVCASLGRDDEAMARIQRSLERRLPPALLAPLHWLEEENPLFYQLYVLPLLHGETGTKAVEP